MNKHRLTVVIIFLFCLSYVQAQIPAIVKMGNKYTLLVDGKPFFMLGGQAHNSSAWTSTLAYVWQSAEYMHLNTLELPVYWEQIEPKENTFDFSLVDTLLAQARAHKVRLVLLWFGTWKNGSNHYMPVWMKQNAEKYLNIRDKNGKEIDSPSPLAEATLASDKTAFAALMRYLKKADARHTVIMVQVENEPGTWGSVRDYSLEAEQLFAGTVPAQLLKPDILTALHAGPSSGGTWQQVFGERADEYFHAWYVARYIGEVAAAGKAEYSLPLYVNAALRDPLSNPSATQYESGGPTDNVIPIWKAAAPAVDVLAPDIYLSGNDRVLKVLDLYNRSDNALFVPEAGLNTVNAKYLFEVISRGGIGFSPFGIDNNGDTASNAALHQKLAPYASEYAIVSSLLDSIPAWSGNGKITSVVESDDNAAQTATLGKWQAIVSFGSNRRANLSDVNVAPTGKVMLIQVNEDEFLVAGSQCHLTFRPSGKETGQAWQYLVVEEGNYTKGHFVASQILNGDETDWGGPGFEAEPMLLRIRLAKR